MNRLLTERLITAANRLAPGTAHDLRALLEVAADTINRLEEERVASRDAAHEETCRGGHKPDVKAWIISANIPYVGFQRHVCMSEDHARLSRATFKRLNGEVEEVQLVSLSDHEAARAADKARIEELTEALAECAASLAWNCFGECCAVHDGPIMPAAGALDMARAALAQQKREGEK